MAETVKIKKGLDIALVGEAPIEYSQAPTVELFALKPTDFHGLVPKLLVKQGDKVKTGTALFYDKANPEVKFVSPVSGEIKDIVRGERRKVLEVIIASDNQNTAEDFGSADVLKLTTEEVKQRILDGGMWPFIKQRPYDIVAKPNETPKAIFISGFDSSPLAPVYSEILKGSEKALQAGINALCKLTQGKVHLGVNAKADNSVYASLKNVSVHAFEGPHPAGNVGIQIHHISPINKGEVVWVINPQDLVALGNLFINGTYDATRNIVLCGSEVIAPRYYKFVLGGSVKALLSKTLKTEQKNRIISGNVLTGSTISTDGFLCAYHHQITVIPEGDYHEFFGWLLPGFGKFSASHAFFSWFCKNKKYKMDSNLHGGHRALVVTGQYEKVFPMDVLPVHLVKSAIAGDIDQMERLGIYEVAPEDFALCEFVCSSKTEVQRIIREGLDLIIKEMN